MFNFVSDHGTSPFNAKIRKSVTDRFRKQ